MAMPEIAGATNGVAFELIQTFKESEIVHHD
jgi:hypothetical protein